MMHAWRTMAMVAALSVTAGGATGAAVALQQTNAPLRYYIEQTNRPLQQEYYRWWTQVGVKIPPHVRARRAGSRRSCYEEFTCAQVGT